MTAYLGYTLRMVNIIIIVHAMVSLVIYVAKLCISIVVILIVIVIKIKCDRLTLNMPMSLVFSSPIRCLLSTAILAMFDHKKLVLLHI